MSNIALNLLADAADVMRKRGVDRDSPEGERTMGKIVGAFNAATGHELSERDGWLFMVFLKAIRAAATPTGKLDDYVDGAAYFALAGEASCATTSKLPCMSTLPASLLRASYCPAD